MPLGMITIILLREPEAVPATVGHGVDNRGFLRTGSRSSFSALSEVGRRGHFGAQCVRLLVALPCAHPCRSQRTWKRGLHGGHAWQIWCVLHRR